jgi:hypothetical protein
LAATSMGNLHEFSKDFGHLHEDEPFLALQSYFVGAASWQNLVKKTETFVWNCARGGSAGSPRPLETHLSGRADARGGSQTAVVGGAGGGAEATMPAPTVSLLASSISMKLPVRRFSP